MTEITITIKINKEKRYRIDMDMESETFDKINEICKSRKYTIADLITNDITEMTPEEAEEIVYSWDM